MFSYLHLILPLILLAGINLSLLYLYMQRTASILALQSKLNEIQLELIALKVASQNVPSIPDTTPYFGFVDWETIGSAVFLLSLFGVYMYVLIYRPDLLSPRPPRSGPGPRRGAGNGPGNPPTSGDSLNSDIPVDPIKEDLYSIIQDPNLYNLPDTQSTSTFVSEIVEVGYLNVEMANPLFDILYKNLQSFESCVFEIVPKLVALGDKVIFSCVVNSLEAFPLSEFISVALTS
jgi:hypothetical protein